MGKAVDLSTLIADLMRLAVGAVFLVAGGAKARATDDSFIASIVSFDLLPRGASVVVARMLPKVEVGLGVVLILGAATRLALVAALAMLGVFTLALAAALLRGLDAKCGCFGSRDQLRPVRFRLIVRNLILLAAIACALLIGKVGIGLDSVDGTALALEAAIVSLVVLGTEVAVVGVKRTSAHSS